MWNEVLKKIDPLNTPKQAVELWSGDSDSEPIRKLPFECESPILKRRTLRNYSINDTELISQ